MKIAFLNAKTLYQTNGNAIDGAVRRVLESGNYILGSEVKGLESELYDFFGLKTGGVLGVNSGTDALILALIAVGVGPGDEVLAPSHTAIPTIAAIVATGATPRFVDVHQETWVLDEQDIAGQISSNTKAIICVHLYGNMVNMSQVKLALAAKGRTDIFIIEDVAQAMGSKWSGKQAGTLGDIGALSFYPTKNLGCLGDGGAVLTQNEEFYQKIMMLRNYGQKSRYQLSQPRGINSRLDEIQAAILRVKMGSFEKQRLYKEQLVHIYRNELEGLPILFQHTSAEMTPNWHLCVIKLKNQIVRDRLQDHLQSQGIEALIHYKTPNHLQPPFEMFANRPLPITEQLANSIISLPMHSALLESEQAYIIDAIKKFFRFNF